MRNTSSRARSKAPATSAGKSDGPDDDYVIMCSEDESIPGGDDGILEPRVSVMLFIPGTHPSPLATSFYAVR